MIRVFLDSSVLFSAVTSPGGASRELLRLFLAEEVDLILSPYVIAEVEENLAAKAPQSSTLFQTILEIAKFERVQPDEIQVREAAHYTEAKDAPVVAAARAG